MSWRYEIRLAGSGGQGVIMAGMILAETLAKDPARWVVMSQAYTPQQRGGPSSAEVIVSDEEIDYPKGTSLDLLVALDEEGLLRNFKVLKRGGLAITEKGCLVEMAQKGMICREIDFQKISSDTTGTMANANIVALGAIAGATDLADKNVLFNAIISHLPAEKSVEYREALEKGYFEGLKIAHENQYRNRESRVETRGA